MDPSASVPRIVLFTGKGGVGKTTTAAATAVLASRAGQRTLVMSTDAAHSLGDALDLDLAGGRRVAVTDTLHALQVAPPTGDGSWRTVQQYLLEVLGSLGVDPVVGEELTSLPGADEIAALLALRAEAGSGRWDLVVVDCAPTAETLRLLALPEALAWHLDRLMPAQRGLIRSLRPAAAAAAGLPLPRPELAEILTRWQRQLREVQQLLTRPQTSVRLVLTPERVVIAESRRTWTSLSLFGFTVDGVVVNRLVPGADDDGAPVTDPWRSAWVQAQQVGLAEVADSFSGVPQLRSPFLAAEPLGVEALAELASRWCGEGIPGPRAVGGGLQVDRDGEGFALVLPLPLAVADDVALQRRGEELVISVGGHRRVLTLPAALQRCIVSGAVVRDGGLHVRFIPDEEVWPRD